MKRLILAALAVAFAAPAFAADLPSVITKGPKPRILTTYNGSGFYYGLNTYEANQRVDIAGTAPVNTGVLSGLGGTFAVGAAVGGTVGWLKGNGTTWFAVEAMADYKNVGVTVVTTNGIPASVDSRWGFTERVKFGGPLAAMLDQLPNLSTVFPVLPASPFQGGIMATTHPYIFGAFHQDLLASSFSNVNSGQTWRLKGGFGIGAMTQLTTGVVGDVWAEYIPAGSGVDITNGVSTKGSVSNGRETRIGAGIYW